MDEREVELENPTILRKGRRMNDQDAFTFPLAISKIAIWCLGTMLAITGLLLSWLCLSTLSLRDQVKDMNGLMLVMSERANNQVNQLANIQNEMQSLRLADASIKMKLEEIQLQQAEHGWKRGAP